MPAGDVFDGLVIRLLQLLEGGKADAGALCRFIQGFAHLGIGDATAIRPYEQPVAAGVGRAGLSGPAPGKDAIDDAADLAIYRDPAFGVELAQRNVNRPVLGAEVVGAAQLLIEQPVGFRRQRLGQIEVAGRKVLAEEEPLGPRVRLLSGGISWPRLRSQPTIWGSRRSWAAVRTSG